MPLRWVTQSQPDEQYAQSLDPTTSGKAVEPPLRFMPSYFKEAIPSQGP